MKPRYVTVDHRARVWEVTNLFDMFGKDTEDPTIAVTCVVCVNDGHWITGLVEDYPIYTVH